MLALGLLLFLPAAAARGDLVQDMAAFERLLIPALVLSGEPDAPPGRVSAALARLAAAWPGFRAHFMEAGEAPARAAREADIALERARARLAAGERGAAHEHLEEARRAFLEARRAEGVELYVDRLAEFEYAMQSLLQLVEAGAEPARVRAALDGASGLWRRAERPGFDPALFGFDGAKYELLRLRLIAQRETLDALEGALARADRAEAAATVRRLKSGFTQIYLMFGKEEFP